MAKKQKQIYRDYDRLTNKALAVLIICSVVISLTGLAITLVGIQSQSAETGPVTTAKVDVFVAKQPSRDSAVVTVNVVGKAR